MVSSAGGGFIHKEASKQWNFLFINATSKELTRMKNLQTLKGNKCAMLRLVLTARWYGMILHEEKLEEYRNYTTYWSRRICNWHEQQSSKWTRLDESKYLVVAFSRGYVKPDVFFLARSITVRNKSKHPEWGEPSAPHYVISLGERIIIEDERI